MIIKEDLEKYILGRCTVEEVENIETMLEEQLSIFGWEYEFGPDEQSDSGNEKHILLNLKGRDFKGTFNDEIEIYSSLDDVCIDVVRIVADYTVYLNMDIIDIIELINTSITENAEYSIPR